MIKHQQLYTMVRSIQNKKKVHHLHCIVQDNIKWLNYVTMVQTVVLFTTLGSGQRASPKRTMVTYRIKVNLFIEVVQIDKLSKIGKVNIPSYSFFLVEYTCESKLQRYGPTIHLVKGSSVLTLIVFFFECFIVWQKGISLCTFFASRCKLRTYLL